MTASVFKWRDAPAHVTTSRQPKPAKFFPGLQPAVIHPANITLTDRHQGAADAHRRDSIKRGAAI